MKNNLKGVAVVVGRNYCNILTTARALGEAGYGVEIVKVFKAKPNPLKLLQTMRPDKKSKYALSYDEVIVNGDASMVADYLLKSAGDCKKLLIPVDDYSCFAVDTALDSLKEKYIVPNVKNVAGSLTELMDKSRQKEIAEKFDVPMPSAWLLRAFGGEFNVPNDIKYPCFIKPNVSMQGTKGIMKRCNDEAELKNALSPYKNREGFEILAEEYIDIKNEYSILGISTPEKTATLGVIKVNEGGNHERKGVAITGETVEPAPFERIIDACNRFVASLEYTGLFDIDLIEDRQGEIYFAEINFRAGASTYVLNKSGINLYGMLADYMLNGKPIKDGCFARAGLSFVSEKVLMEEYARGDASAGKIKMLMNDAQVFFVKDDLDPAPYKYFKRFYSYCRIMRIVYSALGKK